jgi:hypothetical protein
MLAVCRRSVVAHDVGFAPMSNNNFRGITRHYDEFTADRIASGVATNPIDPFPLPGYGRCATSCITTFSVDTAPAANLS